MRMTAGKKISKYRAKKTAVNGFMFDSKAESKRWQELVLMQKVGLISGLERQIAYILAPSVVILGRKRPAMKYLLDFRYFDKGKLQTVHEDVKGFVTPVYRIKRHLMKSVHGIDITEVIK